MMLGEAERRILEELGPLVSVMNIPDAERDLLFSAVVPATPREEERLRGTSQTNNDRAT